MKINFRFLIAAVALSIAIWGCTAKEEEPAKEEAVQESSQEVKLTAESLKQINLETETVSLQPLTGFISLPAKVVTNQDYEAQVGSLVQGRVRKVFVKIGDFVKAGQVIMTVEGFDIGSLKAGYMKAKAELDYAKANYDRQKKLFDEKIGSQKVVLETQAEYQKALAEFRAEDNKIHSVGLSDDDVTNGKTADEHTASTLPIKSPISGVVVERNVVIGQLVDPTLNAFKVINNSSLWVDGQIYEKDLNKINRKTKAVFTTSTYPGEEFDGNVIYIGQTVDESSRTIMIRGEFRNKNNKLKPQMFGELQLPIGENAMAIIIPEEAVVKDADLYYVFVQTGETTFEQRMVKTGISFSNRLEIKEGLKVGEKVATKGVFYLKSELKKSELEGD
ncbi:MAG: efflux RND transporter periplasmic adaptor subunit [bacterium]